MRLKEREVPEQDSQIGLVKLYIYTSPKRDRTEDYQFFISGLRNETYVLGSIESG